MITINIDGPGKPTIQGTPNPVQEGTTLTVMCDLSSDGNPATYNYTWQTNGSFSRVTSSKTLTTTATVEDHDGTWRCSVNNNVGVRHSDVIVIVVYGKYTIVLLLLMLNIILFLFLIMVSRCCITTAAF